MYRPTFEYAFLGKTYTHESSTSSSSPEYEIEEEVDVLVDPDDPREILIDSFWERSFLSRLLGIIGTCLQAWDTSYFVCWENSHKYRFGCRSADHFVAAEEHQQRREARESNGYVLFEFLLMDSINPPHIP